MGGGGGGWGVGGMNHIIWCCIKRHDHGYWHLKNIFMDILWLVKSGTRLSLIDLIRPLAFRNIFPQTLCSNFVFPINRLNHWFHLPHIVFFPDCVLYLFIRVDLAHHTGPWTATYISGLWQRGPVRGSYYGEGRQGWNRNWYAATAPYTIKGHFCDLFDDREWVK